jgi:hypothetical protein
MSDTKLEFDVLHKNNIITINKLDLSKKRLLKLLCIIYRERKNKQDSMGNPKSIFYKMNFMRKFTINILNPIDPLRQIFEDCILYNNTQLLRILMCHVNIDVFINKGEHPFVVAASNCNVKMLQIIKHECNITKQIIESALHQVYMAKFIQLNNGDNINNEDNTNNEDNINNEDNMKETVTYLNSLMSY